MSVPSRRTSLFVGVRNIFDVDGESSGQSTRCVRLVGCSDVDGDCLGRLEIQRDPVLQLESRSNHFESRVADCEDVSRSLLASITARVPITAPAAFSETVRLLSVMFVGVVDDTVVGEADEVAIIDNVPLPVRAADAAVLTQRSVTDVANRFPAASRISEPAALSVNV